MLPESSRDLILHKGDLDLSSYSRHFGRTPSHSDKHLRPEWELEDPEEDAAEEETAKRPYIAGHPNNNNNNKNNNDNNNISGHPNNKNTKCPVVARCQILFSWASDQGQRCHKQTMSIRHCLTMTLQRNKHGSYLGKLLSSFYQSWYHLHADHSCHLIKDKIVSNHLLDQYDDMKGWTEQMIWWRDDKIVGWWNDKILSLWWGGRDRAYFPPIKNFHFI